MNQYFVSYTKVDQPWAEWIAWQLERAGHKTVLQAWDFLPGANFVLKMHEASKTSNSTIAVLSKEYVEKAFPASEWAVAFSRDPKGLAGSLIPVRIEDVKPDGLLSTIVYIDLFDVLDEETARQRLLEGVKGVRAKPSTPPKYPKATRIKKAPHYPGKKLLPTARLRKSEEVEVELRLHRDYESFSPNDQEALLKAIRELLNIDHDIKVTKIGRGSVLVTFKLHRRDALNLYVMHHIGQLSKFGISDLKLSGYEPMAIEDVLNAYNKTQPLPPVPGKTEKGTVVFIDEDEQYGILKRDRGGYLRFTMPPEGGQILGIGVKATVRENHIHHRR